MKEIWITQPVRQNVWGRAGIVNFVLGGIASGFYLVSLLIAALNQSISIDPGIVAAVLIGLGFLTLALEAGRPLRGRYLLSHVTRSWMSRETLAGVVFVLAAILNRFFPHTIFWFLTGASALGLVISHGFIVYNACAVMAWHVVLMPILFVTSAFVLGQGFLYLLVSVGMAGLGRMLVIQGLIFLLLNLAVWLLYLAWVHHDEYRVATIALRRPRALILSVGIGHLLPILLLIMLHVILGWSSGFHLSKIVAAVIGIAVIAGGVSQKSSIILHASYLRGIVMGYPKADRAGESSFR